jgi:hypothetical protein
MDQSPPAHTQCDHNWGNYSPVYVYWPDNHKDGDLKIRVLHFSILLLIYVLFFAGLFAHTLPTADKNTASTIFRIAYSCLHSFIILHILFLLFLTSTVFVLIVYIYVWNPVYVLITTDINFTGNSTLYDSFVSAWSTRSFDWLWLVYRWNKSDIDVYWLYVFVSYYTTCSLLQGLTLQFAKTASSCKTFDTYWGYVQILIGIQSWMRFFTLFLSLSRQMPA